MLQKMVKLDLNVLCCTGKVEGWGNGRGRQVELLKRGAKFSNSRPLKRCINCTFEYINTYMYGAFVIYSNEKVQGVDPTKKGGIYQDNCKELEHNK